MKHILHVLREKNVCITATELKNVANEEKIVDI